MDQRGQQVLLYREPAVRCLHPESAAHPRDFARETLLAGGIAYVFDHRVAEDHVEGAVAERQTAAVAGHPIGRASKVVFRAGCIEQCQSRGVIE